MIKEKEITEKIALLHSLKSSKISHFHYSMKASIPFKAHVFVETMNWRMSDFSESVELLIKHNHITPSVSLIRGIYENNAITYSLISSIKRSIEQQKVDDNIDDSIMSIVFQARYDKGVNFIHITKLIENLELSFKDSKEIYKALCEFVHPNWDGVSGCYSEINEKLFTTDFLKIITTDHSVYQWIESCFFIWDGNIYRAYRKN